MQDRSYFLICMYRAVTPASDSADSAESLLQQIAEIMPRQCRYTLPRQCQGNADTHTQCFSVHTVIPATDWGIQISLVLYIWSCYTILNGHLCTKIVPKNWNKHPKNKNFRIGIFTPFSRLDFNRSARGSLVRRWCTCWQITHWTVVRCLDTRHVKLPQHGPRSSWTRTWKGNQLSNQIPLSGGVAEKLCHDREMMRDL